MEGKADRRGIDGTMFAGSKTKARRTLSNAHFFDRPCYFRAYQKGGKTDGPTETTSAAFQLVSPTVASSLNRRIGPDGNGAVVISGSEGSCCREPDAPDLLSRTASCRTRNRGDPGAARRRIRSGRYSARTALPLARWLLSTCLRC